MTFIIPNQHFINQDQKYGTGTFAYYYFCHTHIAFNQLSLRPPIREFFDPLRKSRDLNAIITDNYNHVTKTLDLSTKVVGVSFSSVLKAIISMPFFREMEHLILSHNQFANSLYSDGLYFFGALPPSLRTLDMSNNKFSNSDILWTTLPTQLAVLCLQNNRFKGAIGWFALPKELETLFLHGNEFEGEIYWYFLPNLKELSTSKNMAHNSISMKLMPQSWRWMDEGESVRFIRDAVISPYPPHQQNMRNWPPPEYYPPHAANWDAVSIGYPYYASSILIWWVFLIFLSFQSVRNGE